MLHLLLPFFLNDSMTNQYMKEDFFIGSHKLLWSFICSDKNVVTASYCKTNLNI